MERAAAAPPDAPTALSDPSNLLGFRFDPVLDCKGGHSPEVAFVARHEDEVEGLSDCRDAQVGFRQGRPAALQLGT